MKVLLFTTIFLDFIHKSKIYKTIWIKIEEEIKFTHKKKLSIFSNTKCQNKANSSIRNPILDFQLIWTTKLIILREAIEKNSKITWDMIHQSSPEEYFFKYFNYGYLRSSLRSYFKRFIITTYVTRECESLVWLVLYNATVAIMYQYGASYVGKFYF